MTETQWMRRKRAEWHRERLAGRRSLLWVCFKSWTYNIENDPTAPEALRAQAFLDRQW